MVQWIFLLHPDLIIQMLLQERCGAISEEQVAAITALELSELEALGRALLNFRVPQDLQRWLDTRPVQDGMDWRDRRF